MMLRADDEKAVEKLNDFVEAVLRGNTDTVDSISRLSVQQGVSAPLQRLAESVAKLAVQSEIREFRLELMVEDLLSTQAALVDASMDALTGLPNRAVFHQKLAEFCELSQETGEELALLFIDLDRFKNINDTMGHDAGDELLCKVCSRVSSILGEQEVFARLGGDEFTVLISGLNQAAQASKMAQRIIELLSLPFELESGTADIGCSVGISYYPAEASTPSQLIKNADVAMYNAKQSGRNRFTLYRDKHNH